MPGRRRSTRRPQLRRATAILEMALTLPVLLFLALGAMDFGQYFYLKMAFESAARDAATAAGLATAAAGDPAAAATTALAQAGVTFNSAWMTTYNIYTPTTDCSTVSAGNFLTIDIEVAVGSLPHPPYRPLYRMTGIGFADSKVLVGHCTVVKD